MKKYIGLFTVFIAVAVVFIFIMINKSNGVVTNVSFMGRQASANSEKDQDNNETKNNIIDDKDLKDNSVENRDGTSTTKESQNNNNQKTNKENNKSASDILLANKNHKLDKGYVPKNLTLPKVKFTSSADDLVKKMEKDAAVALEKMFEAAKQDGITLLGVSGYRSYAIQNNLYNSNVKRQGKSHADRYSAQPGASEHQTGLAMDMLSTEYSSLNEGFENTKAFKWLEDNAYKYGYILRYPKGKENITGYAYEPWHYRYVGIEVSEKITKNKLTLEEYLSENN